MDTNEHRHHHHHLSLNAVTDILFENFYCEGTQIGPRIKTQRGRGGVVRNVLFRNFTLHNVASPIVFTKYYQASLGWDGTDPVRPFG